MTATITAKVTLDGSSVGGSVAQINGQVAQIGSTAEKTLSHATSAVNEHGAAWEKAGDRIIDTLKEIAVAAGLAFSVDKLVEWVKASIEGAERIDHLSQMLGVSTQKLQAFNYIAGLTGASLDTVSTSLVRLERAQVEARDGSEQTVEAFRAVGVSVTDSVTGKLKPADQLIIEVAQHLSTMASGSVKTAAMIQLMGRGAAESTPFFNALGKEFDKLEAKAISLGLVLSSKDQLALVHTQEEFNELGQVVKGLGNQFAIALAPVLMQVTEELERLAQNGSIKVAFQQIANGAQFVVTNFGAIVTIAKILVQIKIATWALEGFAALKQFSVGADLTAKSLFSLNTAIGVVGAAIVGWNIGTYLSENFTEARLAGIFFVSGMLIGWENLKLGAQVAWAYIKDAGLAAYAILESGLAKLYGALATFTGGAALMAMFHGQVDLAKQLAATTTSLQNQQKEIQKASEVTGSLDTEVAALNDTYHQNVAEIDDGIAGMVDYETSHKKTAAAIDHTGNSADDAAKKQMNYNSQIAAAKKVMEEQAKDLSAYQLAMDALTGKLEGPYVKAQEDYDATLVKAHDAYLKEIKDHVGIATAQQHETDIRTAALAVRDDEILKLKEQHNLMAQLTTEMQNQQALQGVAPQYQQAITDGLKTYDDLLKSHFDFYGNYIRDAHELKLALDAQLPGYIAQKQAINDLAAAQKNDEAINKEWQGIVTNGFSSLGSTISDFATGAIKSWKDFGKSLLTDAKQFIGQIIQEFLKLTVFNGIINSLFGLTGSSALPTGLGSGLLGQVFGGGSSGGGISGLASSFFGGGGGGASAFAGSSAGGEAGGVLFGSNSGASGSALDSLTNANRGGGIMGFLFGSSNAFNATSGIGVMGSTDALGLVPDYAGTGSVGTYGSEVTSGSTGMSFGGVLNIAGAIVAGYSAYKAAGGGFAGAAAGAAYGTAAYVGGAALTAGAAAAATGGLAAGATAAFAAIPVIGWIALAAVAVNMISGGKLFGTAGKVIGGSTTETIGAGGASVTSEYTTKGQRALFGGSYTKEHSLAVDQASKDAANSFYAALVSEKGDFASSLGAVAGALIGGSFVQTFDKNGKATGTSDTVNGVTRKGETQAQFSERVSASNTADVLKGLGINIDAFTKNVQEDADKLYAATQDVGATAKAALYDIKHGIGLLGEDGTLADVVNLTIKLNDGTQSLAQTYADLQVGTQLLRNDMTLAGDVTTMTSQQFVEFASAAVKAAGGAQQLASLISTFDKDFYTATEQVALNIASMTNNVNRELAGIGQSPGESLAQFKAAFNAIRDTLTPDELVAWYQAGVDLAALNKNIQDTAAAAQDAAQKYADFEVQTQGDAFVQSVVKAIEAEKAQIDTANKLAIAAGKAGASQRDLSAAIGAGSLAIGQALATLTQGIDDDIKKLFPPISGDNDPSGMFSIYNAGKAKAAADQQKAASDASIGFDIIQKLGDFAFASGKTIDQVLQLFGLSASEIGGKVGETADQVEKQIASAEDQAASLTTLAAQGDIQSGLLTDILEVLQGKPTTYDPNNASAALPDPQQALPGKVGTDPNKVGGSRFFPSPQGPAAQQVTLTPANVSAAPRPSAAGDTSSIAAIPKSLDKSSEKLMERLDRMNNELQALRQTLKFGTLRTN